MGSNLLHATYLSGVVSGGAGGHYRGSVNVAAAAVPDHCALGRGGPGGPSVTVSVLPEERAETLERVRPADPWVTLVWNDPVNLMSYVAYVFESYFGYPTARANQLMLQVHHEGRAVVSSGSRERMEVDVQAMHGFGLWSTMQRGGEL